MTEEPKTYADKLLLGLQRIEEGQRLLGKGPASFWIEQIRREAREEVWAEAAARATAPGAPTAAEQKEAEKLNRRVYEVGYSAGWYAYSASENHAAESMGEATQHLKALAEQAATEPSAPSDREAREAAVDWANRTGTGSVVRLHQIDGFCEGAAWRKKYPFTEPSAPSDEEIEAAYREWFRDTKTMNPLAAFRAAIAWLLKRGVPKTETPPERLVYNDAPYRAAYVDPQPVAVWEPTPALGNCNEEYNRWFASGEAGTHDATNAWKACWLLHHPQPPEPEPEDPEFEQWRSEGAKDVARDAWAARGEQP